MNSRRCHETPTGPGVEYRWAARYRRCAVYALVGWCAAIIGTALFLWHFGAEEWGAVIVFGLLSLFCPAICFVVLSNRIRVDERGVWEKFFGGWDLWSWETFASGRIEQGARLGHFIDRSHLPRPRYLALYLLDDEHREAVAKRIRGVWIPPAPPALPADFTIPLDRRRRAELSPAGIHIKNKRGYDEDFVSWSAPAQVRIVRLEHGRRDCHWVEFDLPDAREPLVLRCEQQRPARTEGPQILAQFVERMAPPERLLIAAETGAPRTIAEADWRIDQLDRLERRRKRALWWIWLVAALEAIRPFLKPDYDDRVRHSHSWLAIGICFGFGMLVYGAMFLGMLRIRGLELRKQRAQLVDWRAALTGSDGSPRCEDAEEELASARRGRVRFR